MKIAAVICNIVLFVFYCFVVLTDGPPTETSYEVFTLWSLLTMIFSPVVISRIASSNYWLGLHVKRNILEERKNVDDKSYTNTIIAFAVLMVLTPILNLVVLIFSGACISR